MRRRLVPIVFGLLLLGRGPGRRSGRESRHRRAVEPGGPDLRRRRARRGQDPRRRERLEGARLRRRRDVTSSFALRANGRFEGARRRPRRSARTCCARRARARQAASITVTNHPNGGPVFSGPQVQPWACQASAVGRPVQPARDLQLPVQVLDRPASSPPTTRRARRPTSRRRRPTRARRCRTSSASRPATRTATSTRSPCSTTRASRSTPWSPQDGWNHKLLITHGASCGIEHQAGAAPDVMNDTALSRGFAVMSTALNNAGHNCNVVTQAESMVMAKERLVEQYGEIRYTIGSGCSGGSLAQQQVANAYPGIYQGILPAVQLPRRVVLGPADRRLPLRPRLRGGPEQVGRRASSGTRCRSPRSRAIPTTSTRSSSTPSTGPTSATPDDGCAGVPAEDNYNAQTNPDGVRCTLADYMINVMGPRPSSAWGPPSSRSATASRACRSTTSACSTGSRR